MSKPSVESDTDLIQHHQDVLGAMFDRIQETTDLLTHHNYDSFVLEKLEPWINFDSSPKTGKIALDFPRWRLDETEMRPAE